MTEQEKREKAIEEMERDVEEALNVPICDSAGAAYGYRKTTSAPTIAARLISKGYRKEKEVQKETVIKILNGLVDIAEKFIGDDYKGIFAAQVVIEMEEFIKKQFGVEVEE